MLKYVYINKDLYKKIYTRISIPVDWLSISRLYLYEIDESERSDTRNVFELSRFIFLSWRKEFLYEISSLKSDILIGLNASSSSDRIAPNSFSKDIFVFFLHSSCMFKY